MNVRYRHILLKKEFFKRIGTNLPFISRFFLQIAGALAPYSVRKLRNVIVVCYLSHYPTVGAVYFP